MPKQKLSASDVLEGVVNDHTADRLTLFDIKNALHERGFGLLMVIFSLPITIPFPYPPGFTTVISIPLLLFSIQMMLGFDSPWLPKWIGEKSIKRTTLAAMIEKSAPYLRRVEGILRPRLSFASSSIGERVIGFACLLYVLPSVFSIPFGHTIPGAGILLMSLGLLSKDGITVLTGMVVGVIGLVLSIILVVLGTEAFVEGWKYLMQALW